MLLSLIEHQEAKSLFSNVTISARKSQNNFLNNVTYGFNKRSHINENINYAVAVVAFFAECCEYYQFFFISFLVPHLS